MTGKTLQAQRAKPTKRSKSFFVMRGFFCKDCTMAKSLCRFWVVKETVPAAKSKAHPSHWTLQPSCSLCQDKGMPKTCRNKQSIEPIRGISSATMVKR